MPDDKKQDEKTASDEALTKVLDDLKAATEKLNKPVEPEKPAVTVPDRRAAIQKSLGYTDEQMAAHEEMIRTNQAPLIERSGWDSIKSRPNFEKNKAEIEKEVALYSPERRTPEMMEKIYHMVVGKHADAAPPAAAPASKTNRVESSRVSGGPGYSGTEGGTSTEKEDADKDAELSEGESFTAKKLGVDEKRYAQAKNSGRDITPLRKPDDRPAVSGADLELRRMQGARR